MRGDITTTLYTDLVCHHTLNRIATVCLVSAASDKMIHGVKFVRIPFYSQQLAILSTVIRPYCAH